MQRLIELAHSYIHYELYWSALCVGQYLLPSSSTNALYVVIRSLHGLGFYKRIQSIIGTRPDLLRYHEIRLIYIKSGFECPKDSSESMSFPDLLPVNRKSLELFYSALFKKESLRKKLFIDSFQADKTNIEPVVYLYKESLCNHREVALYVHQIEDFELRSALASLINCQFGPEHIVCPLGIFSMSLSCQVADHVEASGLLGTVKKCSLEELFRISTRNLEQFSECEFTYFSLGLYYLYKERFREALRCFYRSFDINEEYGMGYLYAGISHSFLKETESAVRILNTAYTIMGSSYLPSYYLAYEYQLMNNLGKTKYYYRNCLNIIEHDDGKPHTCKKAKTDRCYSKEAMSVICGFIYCLIYNEEYEEAMQYIKSYNVKNLLKVFCLLFNGMFDDARKALETCGRDSAYYASKGYLYHLVDDFDPSIREYEKSLSLSKNQVVEDLLAMAAANLAGTKPNKAFDYSNCLFETLEYKNRIVFMSKHFK